MNPIERKMRELRAWYREALRDHVEELERLSPALRRGDPQARVGVERVAHRLRGSGGTFGFDVVSEAARAVESALDDDVLPRLLGLLDLLSEVAQGIEASSELRSHRWLPALLDGVPAEVGRRLARSPADPAAAWLRVQEVLRTDATDLARRLGRGLGREPVLGDELAAAPGAAAYLVPAPLARRHGLLPLREDGERLVVAAAHPTDIRAILALERVAGRRPVLRPCPPHLLTEALERRYGGRSTASPPPEARVGRDVDAPSSVLVVDDDPGTRLLARSVLERSGMRVSEAGTAEETLRHLRDEPRPDLLVLDLDLPDGNGREVIAEVRRAQDGLPVIVLTGAQDEGTEIELIELGADDYLRKPLQPRLFLARVRSTLRRVEPTG